jgi:hypothetical protein
VTAATEARLSAPVSTASVADYVRGVLDRAKAASGAFTRRAAIELPGLSVDVRSFDGVFADAVERNLIRHSGPPVLPGHERMQVFVAHPGVAGMPVPANWAEEPYWPHRIAEVLAAEGLRGSYYHDLDHWHVYDTQARAGVQLMRSKDAYPPWEPGAPLRPFLHWHYAERNMRLAHGGTLGVDGRGVLLAGAGGSGKSGTVIAGLIHGLQSVGDDYVLLGAGSGVIAYPLFATLKQDAAGFQRLDLGRFVSSDLPLNWQGKHQFSIRDIAPCPTPSQMKIEALLVPRVSGSRRRTKITAMPRREAMLALAASSIYQMPGERESGFRFFSSVANELPCFRLELGREPAEIADKVSDFILGRPRED